MLPPDRTGTRLLFRITVVPHCRQHPHRERQRVGPRRSCHPRLRRQHGGAPDPHGQSVAQRRHATTSDASPPRGPAPTCTTIPSLRHEAQRRSRRQDSRRRAPPYPMPSLETSGAAQGGPRDTAAMGRRGRHMPNGPARRTHFPTPPCSSPRHIPPEALPSSG